MSRSANQLTISNINQALIIDVIKKRGRITRADIASTLNLSRPSVSANVEKLLAKGLVLEYACEKTSAVGRKGAPLGLNSEYAYIIGVDLSGPSLNIGMGNLYEEILILKKFGKIEGKKAAEVLTTIDEAICKLLKSQDLTMDNIGAVVICTPGIINEELKIIEFAPQIEGWDTHDVWDALHKSYGNKLILINDVNAITLGEKKAGTGQEYNSFVYINLDVGIGGGIIIGNELVTGANKAAGEIGYMMTDLKQFNCSHLKGSLESEISITAIRERVSRDQKKESLITIEEINELILHEDSEILEEMDRLTDALSMCIVNISSLLDVPVVCLGGMVKELKTDISGKVSQRICGMLPYPPKVVCSKLQSDAFLYGALSLGSTKILQERI